MSVVTGTTPELRGPLHLGIDVGSTTAKAVLLDPLNNAVLFRGYQRHNAHHTQVAGALLKHVFATFPKHDLRLAVCGSAGRPLAEALGACYIQEVVANSLVIRLNHPEVATAIELGGQDAKMIFFSHDEQSGEPSVSEMRMNGSCAGGTGAFIDEIATLLKIDPSEFDALAHSGTQVFDISGRCGVYAKTDIQQLLNQGVPRADIALSSLHALVKQTIGGLAQGLAITAPVIFEGGPLTFNPTLVQVFAEYLRLNDYDIIIPKHPETITALGAAYSLAAMFADAQASIAQEPAIRALEKLSEQNGSRELGDAQPFFTTAAERESFERRHALPQAASTTLNSQLSTLNSTRAYLGIDSGSTTTKFALLDEDDNLIDFFYAANGGEPLQVAKDALIALRERYKQRGIVLDIAGVGTTGYGEQLFASALNADCHFVETIAHAEAAKRYCPDVDFILDIGGQDMKAIKLVDGVITDIIVNEACSSGCGSFLANFANNLDIPVQDIAETAFASKNPASLGSRCTVFMNSCIITEQRSGSKSCDIMAGLCRSVIENVFTKVLRVHDVSKLGNHIVVQGGTFANDAVLRAFEQYLGIEATRAPYPGLMGAIGIAMLTRQSMQASRPSLSSTFIGLDALDNFAYEQSSGIACPFCSNHCSRSVARFADGREWVTGNRCERGAIIGEPDSSLVQKQLKAVASRQSNTPDLCKTRLGLLFKDYPLERVCAKRNTTIGIPRVLEFYNSLPFWTTFFTSLGFDVKLSHPSTRKLYERGLAAISSDTICFPAKLVHGHILDLADQQVNRIFMPSITVLPSENSVETSESVCAVVKGYPIVLRNTDNPERNWSIPFDNPLFYWYSHAERHRQLCTYMLETFGVAAGDTEQAIRLGDAAYEDFQYQLQEQGAQVLEHVELEGSLAVVLAARPYQSDPLVNHDLPQFFTKMSIPVLTADSLPGIFSEDLTNTRIDVVNNYHARMLAAARFVAHHPHLEYVQIVSFGCGHDALLSDEIARILAPAGKVPLVLKLDESDIAGPLNIRIQSFVESVRRRVVRGSTTKCLADPHPVKYLKEHQQAKTILVPNVSRAFCKVMSAAMGKQGVKVECLPLGGAQAIALGKKYVHNDICFPAQIVVGEALAALASGEYELDKVAIGTGKLIGDCRLTHYAALLRKALDEAGYAQVPIITNDDVDQKNIHPGYRMGIGTQTRFVMAITMVDALEQLLHKIRPYEVIFGQANQAFTEAVDILATGIERAGLSGLRRAFPYAIKRMGRVGYDRTKRKSPVLVVGEYLLNFHPGANHDIEEYLEDHGLEVIEPSMAAVYQKGYFYQLAQIRERGVKRPAAKELILRLSNAMFELAHHVTDVIASRNALYEKPQRMLELAKASDFIIDHTFDSGEGFLIPAEILHYAAQGVRSFVVMQPFGCLPNHVCGRGITKRIKEVYPDAMILPLDYDPDISMANIENRLQMLIMNQQLRSQAQFANDNPPHTHQHPTVAQKVSTCA